MDAAIVLENVHDPHNIGAVIRTCDAVGIPYVYLIVSDIRGWDKIELGGRASAGARKWVDVFIYDNAEECFEILKSKYKQILGTALGEKSVGLYELDLTIPTALVFGNEHSGLSEEALQHVTGNFNIPQFGMVQSLNISVACAVSCYELLRQRKEKQMYHADPMSEEQLALIDIYKERHLIRDKGKSIRNLDIEE